MDCNERVQRAKKRRNKNLVTIIASHLKCMIHMLSVTSMAEEEEEVEDLAAKRDCLCDWTAFKMEDEFDNVFNDDSWVGTKGSPSKPINVSKQSVGGGEAPSLWKSAASDASADLCRSSSVGEAWTPDEGLAVYIEGTGAPSKIDVDVMRAIEMGNVDPILYPNIHRWKFFMSTRKQDQGESFSDSFHPLRSISIRNLDHPLTSTPSCSYKNKKAFLDRVSHFNPFLAKNNGNDLQFPDLFQD